MTPIDYLNKIDIENWEVDNIIKHENLRNAGFPFDNSKKFQVVDYIDISIVDKNIIDEKDLTPINLKKEYYPGIEIWESEGIVVKFVIKNALYFIGLYKNVKPFDKFITNLRILANDFFDKTIAI